MQCGANTHLKLQDRVVRDARFLTAWVCVECDIAYRRPVALLFMLYEIRCNPMNPLYGALPVPYVSVQVTRSALADRNSEYRYILMRLLAAEPRSNP